MCGRCFYSHTLTHAGTCFSCDITQYLPGPVHCLCLCAYAFILNFRLVSLPRPLHSRVHIATYSTILHDGIRTLLMRSVLQLTDSFSENEIVGTGARQIVRFVFARHGVRVLVFLRAFCFVFCVYTSWC